MSKPTGRNARLVILLDLSKSMDAQDVKPSRLERAKQEIADILDMNHKVKIGLVAFAAVPHMVVPVTEDMATLRTLLPYLETDLVHVQGSRLKPAIEMATGMLGNELGDQRSILVVSDGGFEDTAAADDAIKEAVSSASMRSASAPRKARRYRRRMAISSRMPAGKPSWRASKLASWKRSPMPATVFT